MLLALEEVKNSHKLANRQMMTINGIPNHYMYLVPGGTWQRGCLLTLQDSRENSSKMIEVSDTARTQAAWWVSNLRAAREESRILDPRDHHRMNPVQIFTDAAGGNASNIKNGAEGFCPSGSWFYMPLPKLIRENR